MVDWTCMQLQNMSMFTFSIMWITISDVVTKWCCSDEYCASNSGERNKSKKPAVHVTVIPVMRPKPSMSSSSPTPSTHSMVKGEYSILCFWLHARAHTYTHARILIWSSPIPV